MNGGLTLSLRRRENRLGQSRWCVSVDWDRSSGMGEAINAEPV